ncbi:MAG: DUF5339 domain-containing protein [Eikenella sp.]|nr:DUF5339 domain-containing protein [Eikenella sp.]
MNKSVLAAMMMAFALSACGDKAADPAPAASEVAASAASEAMPASEAAPASEATPPVEPVSAPAEGAAASAAPAALDATCQAYFDRVEACLAKVDQGVAASFATQNEELKKSLAESPAEQQAAACKQANDMFAESAKALSCE